MQARIVNVTDAQMDYVKEAKARLTAAGIRVETDLRNEKLGFKVREAQIAKIPYVLVVGDKEVAEGGFSVRLRSGENIGFRSFEDVVSLIRADSEEPFKRGGMSYSFA